MSELKLDTDISLLYQQKEKFTQKNIEEQRIAKRYLDLVSKQDKDGLLRLRKETHVPFSVVYDNKDTLLSLATIMNDRDMIEFLIEEGANIQTKFDDGKDIAWLALDMGNKDLFHSLYKRGILLNIRLEDNKTRLMQAVINSDVEMVKFFLAKGINVEARDVNGKTALHYNFAKNPYTEADKEIGVILTAVGLNPKDRDLNDVPAYGYLENIEDLDERLYLIIRDYPLLSEIQQQKVDLSKGKKYKAEDFNLPKSIKAIPKTRPFPKTIKK